MLERWIIYGVVVYGASSLLIYGRPLKWLRDWTFVHIRWLNELLTCHLCLGFWLGLILGLRLFDDLAMVVLFSCWGAAVSFLLHGVETFYMGIYDD